MGLTEYEAPKASSRVNSHNLDYNSSQFILLKGSLSPMETGKVEISHFRTE